MDRKSLKALSWSQISDKVWWILLITFIIGVIAGTAGSVISTVMTSPIIVLTFSAAVAESDPIVFEILSTLNGLLGAVSAYLAFFVTAPLSLSEIMIFLSIANGGGAPKVEDTFKGFKKYWKSVGLYMLVSLFTTLWTFLFMIPGFIKAYAYSMAPYILAESPSVKPLEAITESRKMMNGHKWELFVLDLSFIGWMFLSLVTFGIAGIWYYPYYNATRANFYKKLKGEI